MKPPCICLPFRSAILFYLAVVALTLSFRARAATTLDAKLVPAIVISGPLNSLQQVQYSTNLVDTNAWTVLSYLRLELTPKAFYDVSASGERRFYRTKMIGVADTNLVWIPPGTFLMGSPTNEEGRISTGITSSGAEGPQTVVTLTKGFLMGRFEVKNAEWVAYMTNIWAYSGEINEANGFRRPVHGVTWLDASNYCAFRTADEQQRGLIPPGWIYRLPTEAEWEYACRAGTSTPFGIGNGTELRNDDVRHDAYIDGHSPYPTNLVAAGVTNLGPATVPVGSYSANGWGLYDMHGNVSEYCWDKLSTSGLPGGAVTNLLGFIGGDPRPSIRGGGFDSPGSDCRSARRRFPTSAQNATSLDSGLRVVLIPVDDP